MNNVPVLLTVFNRVDLVSNMLDALSKMRPPILYIAADGPRLGVPTDEERCSQVRHLLDNVKWPCQVVRLYHDDNFGCGRNVSGAISQVLKEFDRIIVLEDDCVPQPSFLPFCSELLDRYEGDSRVSMVCGSLPMDFPDSSYSYFFSRYYSCWGWATWRRSWENFDFELESWPVMRNTDMLRSRFLTEHEYQNWCCMLERVYKSESKAWAAQWGYACRKSGGLAAFSHRSLISNTGVGHELSTHSGKKEFCSIWEREVKDIEFPICHPPSVLPDIGKEHAVKQAVADVQHMLPRLRSKIKALPSLIKDVRNIFKIYNDIV